MVSGSVWLPLTEERCWLPEEQKAEKNYLCLLKLDIKNNVDKNYIKGVVSKSNTFFYTLL